MEKLFEKLRSLKSADLQALSAFLNHRYFAARPANPEALLHLVRSMEKGKDLPQKKAELCRLIGCPSNTSAKTLANRQSEILHLVNEFLTLHHFKSKESNWALAQAEYGLTQHDKQLFGQAGDHFKKRATGPDFSPQIIDYQWARFENYCFELEQDRTRIDDHINTAMGYLDHIYLHDRLRLLAEMMNRQQVNNAHYDTGSLSATLDLVHTLNLSEDPVIKIYCLLIGVIQTFDQQVINELATLYQQHKAKFDKDEQHDLLVHIRNICARRINKGEISLLDLWMDLTIRMMDEGLDKFNESGRVGLYKNTVAVGLKNSRLPWTRSFIESYAGCLPAHCRSEMYHLAMAQYYLSSYLLSINTGHRKLLEKSFNHLQKSITEAGPDQFINSAQRKMQLMLYMEMDEWQAAGGIASSFIKQLSRNKKRLNSKGDEYMTFVRWAKKVIALKISTRAAFYHSKLERLFEAVKQANKFVSQEWLLGIIKRGEINHPSSSAESQISN